jgi:hypothetical protein
VRIGEHAKNDVHPNFWMLLNSNGGREAIGYGRKVITEGIPEYQQL